MTESMRRAPVIGDAPASRIRATGLGTSRNGLPDVKPYVHPGWVDGVPSPADNPGSTEERSEACRRGRIRKLGRERAIAEGRCPECTYPADFYGHFAACEDGS